MGTDSQQTRYIEEIKEGATVHCGSVRLSETDIKEFAHRYDPLAIHTDPDAAADSRFGGLIASGYQTLLISVRKVVEAVRRHRAVIAGLGMDNVCWHEPVRPEDTVSVATTVVETRPASGNPDAGVLREQITVTNQFDTVVLSLECFELVERKRSMASRESNTACSAWDNGDCQGTAYCPPRCPRFIDENGQPLLARPYQSADRGSLRQLYDDTELEGRTGDVLPADMSGSDAWLERSMSDGWSLVALAGDRVVGHAAVVSLDLSDPTVLIVVHPEYRDRGIGLELAKQVIAYADIDTGDPAIDASSGQPISVREPSRFDVVDEQLSDLRAALRLQHPITERVRQPPAAHD